MVLNIYLKKEIEKINNALKFSFKRVKEELDNYLDTINQNTNEIQNNYEFLLELDRKVDTLSERVDEITLLLEPSNNVSPDQIDLTIREQEVFLVLYAINKKLSAGAIARRLGLTPDKVNDYLQNLMDKQVPVLKEIFNNRIFYFLDDRFRSIQAKQNIIKIDSSVSNQLLHDEAI